MMEFSLGARMDDSGGSSERTKVSVAVRVRPLIEREKTADAQICWQIGAQELQPYDPVLKRIAPNAQTYTYDHVFDMTTQTQEVYDTMVSPIVKKAFRGFNGTILCYGQTSSGKTHTLYGSNDDKGIILLFADHLYQHIKADESHRQYIIKVGLIEIYNEKVSDLLNSYNPIELQERDGSIVPYGLEELTVFDIDDWKKVTERVQRERKIGETRMNKESSRSHTILRVTIESFDLTTNTAFDDVQENPEQSPPLTTAVLHFVDLAGSEKQSQTGTEGERFKEQVNINMSLSVLSRVIKQLSEQASVTESHQGRTSTTEQSLAKAMCQSLVRNPPKSRFINFRDSKLTRLLQSSLNGEAFISMVCNVTIASLDETKSTLQFAKQAKKIQIRPKQNLCSTKSEYDKKLQELQELLNSKDKEVLVLRRQCENMKRAFEFRDEQSTQRAPNIDRRLSLCPTMFRSSADKTRHSNPEPMSMFSYYKNKYSSSSKLNSLGLEDGFMSANEFVKTLRSPLKSIRESINSDVIRLDKEVQTESCDTGDEKGLRLLPLSTIRESPYENSLVGQQVIIEQKELPTTPDCQFPRKSDPQGTPAPMLRLNNALLRTANEDDRVEYSEMKTYLESEIATLQDEVRIIPKLKAEIETLQTEKKELENDVMRQMQASRVEMNRRLAAESPEVLALKNRLQAAEETVANKDNVIQTITAELHSVKMHQEKSEEVEQQLRELQNTIEILVSAKEDLEKKHRHQTEICEEQVKQLEEQRSLILSVTKQAEDHELCQDLASKLKLAENQVEELVANEFTLQQQLKVYQDALDQAESRVITEVSELKIRLQEAEEQGLKKGELIETVTTEFKTLKDRYQELEPKLKELRSAIAKLMSAKEILEQAVTTQTQQIEKHHSMITSLSEVVEEAQAAQKDELIQNISCELESVKTELEKFVELESQLLDLETINMKLLSTNEELELKLENQVKICEEQQCMITAMRKEAEEHGNLAIKLRVAEDQVEELTGNQISLQAQLKAQQDENKKAESRVEEMKVELTTAQKARLTDLKNKLLAAEEQILNKEKLLEMVTAELTNVKSEKSKYEELQQQQLKELENGNLKLISLNEDLKGKLSTQMKICEEQTKQIDEQRMKQTDFEKTELLAEKLRAELAATVETLKIEKTTANEHLQKLNKMVEEHGNCQQLDAFLNIAQEEVQKLTADKLADDEQLEVLRAAHDNAELVMQKMREELTVMKKETEIERRNAEDQIEKLNQIVIEHQKCEDLVENLKTARDQVNQLKAKEALLEAELKAQQDGFDKAKEKILTEVVGLMDRVQVAEEQVAHKDRTIATITLELESANKRHEELESQLNDLQSTNVQLISTTEDLQKKLTNQTETCTKHTRYIEDQRALIASMNKLAEEHEQCRDLSGRLKFAEDQIDKIRKSKEVLQRQHLEAQQGLFARLKVAEDQVGKLMTNNVALQHQQKAYQDMTAKLSSAQDQVERLMVEKVALEQELKSHQDMCEKVSRGVVITRATQCSDLSTEMDHFRDASKHYRTRAHNAEFELERAKKALEEVESELQMLAVQLAPQESATSRMVEVLDGQNVSRVNRGLQCTLLNELLQKRGEGETRLAGLPGITQLQSDLKTAEVARDKLKYELSKCNCGRKQFGAQGSEKSADTITTKYNVPTGFQRKVAFFQGGSTLMNTKESLFQPKPMPIHTVKNKQEPKSPPAPPKDPENIENTPEQASSSHTDAVLQPVEMEPESDDYNWLMQLVHKKT